MKINKRITFLMAISLSLGMITPLSEAFVSDSTNSPPSSLISSLDESMLANFDPQNLGLFERTETGRTLLRAPSNSIDSMIGSSSNSRQIEVIVSLNGNSLMAEQARLSAAGLSKLDASAQKAYVQSLREMQAGVVAELVNNGGLVLYTYQIVYNGIAVMIDSGNLQSFDHEYVINMQLANYYLPALENSVPFIFDGKTNEELGVDGEGVTIAIIDTGIDYTHASLGGSGDPLDFINNDPTTLADGGFPNAKVIGGIDLVGENYDASIPSMSIPNPDDDPLDQHGHGSHVSGIAAGLGTANVSPGVAPGASLLAVKVFSLGSTSNSVILAALEYSVDPDRDGDTSDRADVINMSLGSPFGRATSLDSVATDAAVAAGAIVVTSAGNSGDQNYITGSPGVATNAISVAAGNDPGVAVQGIQVDGTAGGVADGLYESIESAFSPPLTVPITGVAEFVGTACDDDPLLPDLTGTIAFIVRGGCRFDEKVLNAENANAMAAIVFNNAAGAGPISMGGDPIVKIPAFMIGNLEGVAILNALTSSTTFTLDPANVIPIPNRIAGFSSRGPRMGDSFLKPDVTAPGSDIASVGIGSGDGSAGNSGTSMAAPHVAGAAALLRQLHPDWSVDQIKSLLMNTATDTSANGEPYPVSRQGAGRVQVNVAVDTESVIVPGSASFGVKEGDHDGKKTYKKVFKIQNLGDENKIFSVDSSFLFADDDEGSIQIKHKDRISVKAGQTKWFTLKLKVDFDMLEADEALEEYDGFVTFTEITDGGDVLRLPFHIIPIPRADGEVDDNDHHRKNKGRGHRYDDESGDSNEIELENEGLRGTIVDVYQFGVWDANEDLISEAPGMPRDPDNWFDLRTTGVKIYDVGFNVLEFAMSTWGDRTAANIMETDFYIDADKDGIPEYAAIAADFFEDGSMVSALFVLGIGGWLMFFISNDAVTSVQTVPIDFDFLNVLAGAFGLPGIDVANPDFDYWAVTIDLETGSFDETGVANFNIINPITPSLDYFYLDVDDEIVLTVTATENGGLLFLFMNNKSGRNQAQVVKVKV